MAQQSRELLQFNPCFDCFVQNGPVANGFVNGVHDNCIHLGGEVVAESIEEAAAVIVECAMNGALHAVGGDAEEGASGQGQQVAAHMSPSTTDSGITMMTNGLGKNHIEMDASEPNGSTTTDTSALSEVIDQVIDRATETLANEQRSAMNNLVDLSEMGVTTSPDETAQVDPEPTGENEVSGVLCYSLPALQNICLKRKVKMK